MDRLHQQKMRGGTSLSLSIVSPLGHVWHTRFMMLEWNFCALIGSVCFRNILYRKVFYRFLTG